MPRITFGRYHAPVYDWALRNAHQAPGPPRGADTEAISQPTDADAPIQIKNAGH